MPPDQGGQETEFDRRKMDRFTGAHHLVGSQVDADLSEPEDRGVDVAVGNQASTTQLRSYPGKKLRNAERFDQIVVRAGVQGLDLFRLLLTRGEDHDGRRRPGAQLPNE